MSVFWECTLFSTAEELSVTDAKADTEKADMRIVQAAAQEVLASSSFLLRHLLTCINTVLSLGVGQAWSCFGAWSCG